MEEKVRRYLEQFHMLQAGDTVVAGVSGGADSVCLLLLLDRLSRQIGFSLAAVHVEHGIRGEESREDADFTERLCQNLGVPFMCCSVDAPRYREETGRSLEEAARELRYDCFRSACEQFGADRIALGHNAGDCAETMLFHLARGTGLRGLGGIRPVTEWSAPGKEDSLTIIRPLLCVTRGEIEAWLAACGQAYRTDSTNADMTYSRNRIRERVLPELEQINPQAVPHMLKLSGQLEQICDYLDEAAWKAGTGIFTISGSVIRISCAAFLDLHEVLRSHLLLQLIGLASGSRRDITARHVEQVMQLMTAQVGTQTVLPGRITAEKTYDSVVLCAEEDSDKDEPDPEREGVVFPEEMELVIPGDTVTENGLVFSAEVIEFSDNTQKIPRKSYTKWFDYDKIKTAVRLRSRRAGDYLQTGADGRHKKLNRLFIDEKIPASERDRICLLADGDHIMWVVGYRISEAYKVTERTRRVLSVTVSFKNIGGGESSYGGEN